MFESPVTVIDSAVPAIDGVGSPVIGVDIVDSKIDLINNGKPTIIEKDIDQIIFEQWKKGKISATKDYIKAVNSYFLLMSISQ